MSKNSHKGGIFKGNSHAEGGIDFKVPETGQQIEVEGNEPLIPNEAVSDPTVRIRKGTNKEILTQINKKVGAKSMDEKATEVHAGDTIVCKKAMTDSKTKTAKGTDRQIVSAINTEAGCKEIEKGAVMDSGGGVQQYGDGGGLWEGRMKIGGEFSGKEIQSIVSQYESQEGTDMVEFAEDEVNVNDTYQLRNIDIDKILSYDIDLKDYVDSEEPYTTQQRINHPILLGKDPFSQRKDVVRDGYHRILQAISNADKSISAFVPSSLGFQRINEISVMAEGGTTKPSVSYDVSWIEDKIPHKRNFKSIYDARDFSREQNKNHNISDVKLNNRLHFFSGGEVDELNELIDEKYDDSYITLSMREDWQFYNQDQSNHYGFKPRGVWMGIGDNWIDYAENTRMFDYLSDYISAFDVKLDKSKLVILSNRLDVQEFTDDYSNTVRDIDWEKVAEDYSGIIVYSPRAYAKNFEWLWGWDITSVCVWNEDAIESHVKVYGGTEGEVKKDEEGFATSLKYNNGGATLKRYIAEADYYVYAKNDKEAEKKARKIASEIDEKYDNKAIVTSLHEQPFGKLGLRTVFNNGGSTDKMKKLKKSDIIKILKPKGFIKAVGNTQLEESNYRDRFTKQGMNVVVAYDHTVESYIIESADKNIYITQVDTNDWDKFYLDKICKVLIDNGIDCKKEVGLLIIDR